MVMNIQVGVGLRLLVKNKIISQRKTPTLIQGGNISQKGIYRCQRQTCLGKDLDKRKRVKGEKYPVSQREM